MPIDVSWLYQKRIIKIRHQGRITSQQLIASFAESEKLTSQGIAPVHTIIDGREVDGTIEFSLGDLRKMIPKVSEGSGLVISIQPRALDRFFTSLGMQLAGAHYKFAPDEQTALQMLLEYDPSLQNIIE
jgi:hypothetical protein